MHIRAVALKDEAGEDFDVYFAALHYQLVREAYREITEAELCTLLKTSLIMKEYFSIDWMTEAEWEALEPRRGSSPNPSTKS